MFLYVNSTFESLLLHNITKDVPCDPLDVIIAILLFIKRMYTFQVVTDNFYTGVKLGWALIKRGTYTIGTLRTSRKFLPDDIFAVGKNKMVRRSVCSNIWI